MAIRKMMPVVTRRIAGNTEKAKKVNSSRINNIVRDKQTRSQIFQAVSELTGLPKVHVEAVFSATADLLQGHMKKRGSGEFTIPMTGIKIRRVKKKPTRPRNMVSPLTGQEVVIPAKPARFAIKLTALKTLKSTVSE